MAKKTNTIVAYKGFDKNLRCHDFQFEVGKSYTHKGRVEACRGGFHACTSPLDVLCYYPFDGSANRFARVELSGQTSTHYADSKIAAETILVAEEIGFAGLVDAEIDFAFGSAKRKAKAASGYGSRQAASGYGSTQAASGDGSKQAASGDGSTQAASGYGSTQAASGYNSRQAASGDGSTQAASGNYSTQAASGYGGVATPGPNGAIALAYFDNKTKRPRFAVGYVGEDGIEAGVAYKADPATGKLVRA